MTLEEIIEMFPEEEFLTADGFDGAIVGVEPNTMRLVYNRDYMVRTLIMKDKMTRDESIEFLEFNVFSAHMGDKTPIYIEI
jgi:hypothetical protein